MSEVEAWIETLAELIDQEAGRAPREPQELDVDAPEGESPATGPSDVWRAAWGGKGLEGSRQPGRVLEGKEGLQALDAVIRMNDLRRRGPAKAKAGPSEAVLERHAEKIRQLGERGEG